MTEVDLIKATTPKSDQLNADDLRGISKTIKITKVLGTTDEKQPIAIHFEGDNGKPFKPCKSMTRVLIRVWGTVASEFVGRSMTLYCDDKVVFGGLEVGGIRISHMSNIEKEITMALTASKTSRKPFTVKPLTVVQQDHETQKLIEEAKTFAGEIELADSEEKLTAIVTRFAVTTGKLAVKLPAWHDKLLQNLETQRSKFSVNPAQA